MATTMIRNLPLVRHLASLGDPGTQPRLVQREGVTVVMYSSTRLLFRADAFEQLPPDGILLVHIRPNGQRPFAVAVTRREAEREFVNVFRSRSWKEHGYYHYPTFPERAAQYIVPTGPKAVSRSS